MTTNRLAYLKLKWCFEFFHGPIYHAYLSGHEWLSNQGEDAFFIFQQLVHLSENEK